MSLLTIVLSVLLPPVAVIMKRGFGGCFYPQHCTYNLGMGAGCDTCVVCE